MRTQVLIYPPQGDGDAPIKGKFLQFNLVPWDYILFGAATEYHYHNEILARFLSEQGIPHRWEGAEHLVVEDPELRLKGGGRFRLDPTQETLHVWDESSVYGRFDPAQLRAQLAAAGPPWERFVLSVE